MSEDTHSLACWAMPVCGECGRRKKPVGRDAGLMRGAMSERCDCCFGPMDRPSPCSYCLACCQRHHILERDKESPRPPGAMS